MSDIALIWDGVAADVAVIANDLALDEGLETAVELSLFTDRRADEGDSLPDGETNRRGWWADDPLDRIGSRLWLLDRAKETAEVLERAEQYAREALQWLIDDLVATKIDVTAEPLTQVRGFGLAITIYRPARDPARYRFDRVWSAQEARS